MKSRKGIVLAGGTGSRLWPITLGVSKQLLPVHDKPMIYYPLSVLMQGGLRDIAVITTPQDQKQFQRLLGDGSQWGINISYIIQRTPNGIAQAYTLAEKFLDGSPSALVLGDNIFHGHGLNERLNKASQLVNGGTVFGYQVADPERYGVLGFDEFGKVVSLQEKPAVPASNYAVTGLYYLDESASQRVREIQLSKRGELEITDLLKLYLDDDALTVEQMGRGYAWLDTGTHESLLDASNFVRTLQKRQGLQVGSPDAVAFEKGWLEIDAFVERADMYSNSDYGVSLRQLIVGK